MYYSNTVDIYAESYLRQLRYRYNYMWSMYIFVREIVYNPDHRLGKHALY